MGTEQLRPVRPFVDRPSARQHNAMVQVLQNLVRSGGRNAFISADGQIHFRETPSKAGGWTLFRVREVHDNYLTCRRDDSTNDVYVAKPPELQRETYDGVEIEDPLDSGVTLEFTYTSAQERTASNGGESEDQRIVPWYWTSGSGCPIYAVPIVTNVLDDDGETRVTCAWMDANFAARAWAKKAE